MAKEDGISKKMAKLNQMRIERRLTKGFQTIVFFADVAILLGIIATFVVSNRYAYALTDYGFSQGDIGKAFVTLAETRSATRAIIGYESEEAIQAEIEYHDTKKEAFEGYMEDVTKTLSSKEEIAIYNNITEKLDTYWGIEEEIINLGATSDSEMSAKAQQMAYEQLDPMYEEIYTDVLELLNTNVNRGNSLSSSLKTLSMMLVIAIAVITVIVYFVSQNFGKKIAEGIAVPMGQLSERFKTFARGDLSSPFPEIRTKDEIADMVEEVKYMAENLNIIIHDAGELLGAMAEGDYTVHSNATEKYSGDFEALIQAMRKMKYQMSETLQRIEEASQQVSIGAGNLADAAQALAEGSTDQAASVEELQATFADITEGVNKTAEHVEESYRQAQEYAAKADGSREEMQAMVDSMNAINETSQQIENIISEIESIASQTNLLSLNAAIEAARAGEAGKGFAVVAEQIGKLAEQSAQSAVDTRQLIEGSLQEIEEGNKAAERAATSIEGVVEGMRNIAASSKELSEISASQAMAMQEAEAGINQISEVIQSNSATAEESSATSEELSAQATSMNDLVGKFILARND
ncbi:MAG: methyl-accepting chemotaxis protein [Roseburia sp.]